MNNNGSRNRGKKKAKEATEETSSSLHPPVEAPLENIASSSKPKRRNRRKKGNNKVDSRREDDIEQPSDILLQPSSSRTSRIDSAEPPKNVKENPRKIAVIRDEAEYASRREYLTAALKNETYDCMICLSHVRRNQAIYNCPTCHCAFHLKCITQWSNIAVSDNSLNITGERGWRCPSCQTERKLTGDMLKYWCYCGKTVLDESRKAGSGRFIAPHSCGQSCQKLLAKFNTTAERQNGMYQCHHKCVDVCHPGACGECQNYVPEELTRCYCGRTRKPLKCRELIMLQAEGKFKRSCDSECGKLKPCGKHRCKLQCHPYECDSHGCVEFVEVKCHCGKHRKAVECRQITDGFGFSCGDVCEQHYSCKEHVCERVCHPIKDGDHDICAFIPSRLNTCPCGKLEPRIARLNCTDPLPETCDNICGKLIALECGHKISCDRQCHYDACLSKEEIHAIVCNKTRVLKCTCGHEEVQVECSQAESYSDFKCGRRCNRPLKCGKHRCDVVCCGLSKVEHVCELVCSKKLNCGRHECELKCHKGNCPKCTFRSMDEYRCECGSVLIRPPIYCETIIPKCYNNCVRERACGHHLILNQYSYSSHTCHPSDEPCPPCPLLVDKPCLCGKEIRRNVKCSSSQVMCANICGVVMSCGHPCDFGCHVHERGDEICSQICNKTLKCGHGCTLKCHPSRECQVTCVKQVKLACTCGVIQRSIECSAVVSPVLPCEEECARIARNKRFAEALELKIEDFTDTFKIPPLNPLLIEIIRRYPSQCKYLLNKLKEFLPTSEPVLRFEPMKGTLRGFIHMIVKDFGALIGIESKSEDFSKNRSVTVFRKIVSENKRSLDLFLRVIDELVVQTFQKQLPTMILDDMSDMSDIEGKECVRRHVHVLNTFALKYPLSIELGKVMTDKTESELMQLFGNSVQEGSEWLSDVMNQEKELLEVFPCDCDCKGCSVEALTFDSLQDENKILLDSLSLTNVDGGYEFKFLDDEREISKLLKHIYVGLFKEAVPVELILQQDPIYDVESSSNKSA